MLSISLSNCGAAAVGKIAVLLLLGKLWWCCWWENCGVVAVGKESNCLRDLTPVNQLSCYFEVIKICKPLVGL
ncbi:unnamed protein product [Camellia sinensis]